MTIADNQSVFYFATAQSPAPLHQYAGQWLAAKVGRVLNFGAAANLFVTRPDGSATDYVRNVPVAPPGAAAQFPGGFCSASTGAAQAPEVLMDIGGVALKLRAGRKVTRKAWPAGSVYAPGTTSRLTYNDIMATDWVLVP